MKRRIMYYTSRQIENLDKIAKEKGITFSELVRRVLDTYLDEIASIKDKGEED